MDIDIGIFLKLEVRATNPARTCSFVGTRKRAKIQISDSAHDPVVHVESYWPLDSPFLCGFEI